MQWVKKIIFVVAVLGFALVFQGSRGLWERDEGRYAYIAGYMMQNGEFVVPAFNDEQAHFAKPPMTYWAIIAGIEFLGWNEWGVRLPNVLAFTLTVILTFFLAKRITPSRPWLPPLVYMSFLFPFIAANIVTTDTLLVLWETLAVFGFVCWYESKPEPSGRLFLLLMWLGFALAFLTKGTPALLPLVVIMVFLGLSKDRRALLRLINPAGTAIFLMVGLGWYLFVALKYPGMLNYFLKDELWYRITSRNFHRNPEWYGAFIVYGPVLIGGTLPWTFLLVRKIKLVPKYLLSRAWWRTKREHDRWGMFLVLWILVPLAIFCVSRSKLPLYVLPLFVPLALLTGRVISKRFPGRLTACFLVAWLVGLVVLKWEASRFPYHGDCRTLSRLISAIVDLPPSELLFVDARPLWGLGFYLKNEVEGVASGPVSSCSKGRVAGESLAEELRDYEPGTLIITNSEQMSRISVVLERFGLEVREMKEIASWIAILPEKESNGLKFGPKNNRM